jgi:hypothetical protein
MTVPTVSMPTTQTAVAAEEVVAWLAAVTAMLGLAVPPAAAVEAAGAAVIVGTAVADPVAPAAPATRRV